MQCHTCVVVPLVFGLVVGLLPEVCSVLADAVGDALLLVGQRGAEHAVHGPSLNVQAPTQSALVLLHSHTACNSASTRRLHKGM